MKVQAPKSTIDPVPERLRHYQVSQGLTWNQVADKLGLSRGMLMMVLRGDRHLSAKALFRLEQAEREVADRKSAAQRIVETLIDGDDVVPQILGQQRKQRKAVDIAVEYERAKTSKSLPAKLSLAPPAEKDCRKLRVLFAETLDTRVIALACLPKQFRSEGFLNQLTAESRTRLTNTALGLVIPDWRTRVSAEM